MVNILASRMAGLKLAWVIITLLIPVAVLGYFLNSEIQGNLQTTKNEIQAAKLFQVLAPALQNAAGEKPDPKQLANMVQQGAPLANSLGLGKQFTSLTQTLKSDGAGLSALLEFIQVVRRKSLLNLDPIAETRELASLTTQYTPAVISSINDLQTIATNGQADAGTELKMAQAAGRLQRDIDTAIDSIEMARDSSTQPKAYDALVESLQTVRSLSFNSPAANPATRAANVKATSPQIYASVFKAFDSAMVLQRTLLEQRESTINTKSIVMAVLSLGSILIGLGSALRMFQSSLVRLDDLESSKLEADTARHDAEDMNARLTIINNEIVTLNTELADKMRRLKEAQDELLRRGRMEQLGQLTATVAHELRNPLGAVRTSAFLLERKLKDKGLGVESQLARINNGITRCDSIITQLLDFSRTKQVAATPADLDNWLAQTIEEEARRIPAAVTIECTLGLDQRPVPFDPARLQRAVINLIANAAEAMVGTGEDPSKFTTDKPVITISTRVAEDMAVLDVSDNGPGIAPEILEKIREPLFTTKSFGTGLGIPAVEQIVVQHGGRLDIAAQTGHGARFSIYLPFKLPQVEAA
jgi:signal transduction histidine kinase